MSYGHLVTFEPFPHADRIEKLQAHLAEQGVTCMILGCTELPIAFEPWNTVIPTVDPTDVLARAALRYVGCKLK